MRTFIAVEIPDDVKKIIGNYIDSIRGSFKSIKWVSPENLHLTIKFLGEVKEYDLQSLSDCVAKVSSDFSPFTMGFLSVGFFPSRNNMRVIWIGADGGADNLLGLFHELEDYLEKLGFDRETRAFSPHLTIGRAKRHFRVKMPENLPDFNAVNFDVKSIAIIKSTLTPQGPVYEKLFESELKQSSI